MRLHWRRQADRHEAAETLIRRARTRTSIPSVLDNVRSESGYGRPEEMRSIATDKMKPFSKSSCPRVRRGLE